MLTEEKAARMMTALRAGQTLRKFGVKPAGLEGYFAAHSEYAQEATPLIEANRKAAQRRKGYLREKTHCVNGHSLAEHGRVAVHKGWMTRQCRACERMRYYRGDVIKPDVLKKVTARIIAGSSLSSFTTAGEGGYLVRFSTLARYRRENPEFDRLVVHTIKDSISRGLRKRRTRIKNGLVREQNNDYYKIRAMLPTSFPDKDDVVSAIFEDLLTGNLQRDEVKARVQTYITAHNRMFPTKFAKFGDSALLSLDEVMFDGGTTTRGDTISRGLWD